MKDGKVIGIKPTFTDVVFEKPEKPAKKEQVKAAEGKPTAAKKTAKKG